MAEVNFELPKMKVAVKPILRDGIWLEKGHSGNWQYDNCSLVVTVPIDKNTGYIKEVLTQDERAFFESKLSGLDFKEGDLIASKKKDNFWKNYSILIQKPESIVKDESILFELDLSNPFDYIKYAVLRANTSPSGGQVAPSWSERYNSGTYKIVMVKEQENLDEVVTRSSKKMEAYKYLGVLQKSILEMYEFLSVYWLSSKTYKMPPVDSTKEFYISEYEKLVDNDLDGVVNLIKDKDNYPIKLLLHKALKVNVITYSPSNGFETRDGIPLGSSMSEAVSFLKNDKNQQHYLKLKNYVELNSK